MRLLVHDYAGHPFQIQLSRELARRGHTVLHAFAGNLQTPRGALSRTVDDAPSFDVREVKMDAAYSAKKYSFVRRRRMEIRYGHEVARLIDDWKPEVVISGNTPTEAQTSIVRACRKQSASFVYWLQDFYSIAVDKLARRKLPIVGAGVGWWYRFLDRKHFAASDAIVVITDDFRPILADLFAVDGDRIHTIPNWGPLADFPTVSRSNDWSREHGLEDRFVFLYTGTLGMKHNPDLLLQLGSQYRQDPNVRIVVISEGIGAEWLLRRCQDEGLTNIAVYPYQPFEQMPSILASGDLLISVLEADAGVFSVPSKVLTYFCAGRAQLAAVPHDNLVTRLIGQAGAGITVDPSDVGAFLEAANLLKGAASQRIEMGQKGRKYAEATFAIDRIASEFEDVFNNSR